MQLIRFYGDLRFKMLTVFVAITAALLSVLLRPEPLSPRTLFGLHFAGVLTGMTFWVCELSGAFQWRRFAGRAVELETVLGYRVYSVFPGAPRFHFMLATYFISIFYATVVTFWLLPALPVR